MLTHAQRRYDTVDLCAIIAKFNCIPMESRDAKMAVNDEWHACNNNFEDQESCISTSCSSWK